MIVILEGLDETGKSTMANYLKERGFLYLNDDSGKLFDEGDRQFSAKGSILSLLEIFKVIHKEVNLVVDRFHLSEYVYGIANRGYRATYIFGVDRELARLDTRLIYMIDYITRINNRANKDLNLHEAIMNSCFTSSLMRKHKFNLKLSSKALLFKELFGQMKLFE